MHRRETWFGEMSLATGRPRVLSFVLACVRLVLGAAYSWKALLGMERPGSKRRAPDDALEALHLGALRDGGDPVEARRGCDSHVGWVLPRALVSVGAPADAVGGDPAQVRILMPTPPYAYASRWWQVREGWVGMGW